jgi:endonuclease/exonuclease/phosphatase family metal-dependent hydrolase
MAKNKFSIFTLTLLILNIIAVIALFMAYLANYLNPKLYFIVALSGLFYPYILLVNVLFIVFLFFRMRKYCFLSLIAILLGFNSLQRLYQFRGKDIPSKNADLVKILSYNVQIFGLYNNENKQDEIIHFLKEEMPDITCLQEYCQDNTQITRRIKETVNAENYYLHTPLSRGKYQFGMVIFSKFPIVNKGTISFENSKTNHAIFVDLKINDDTIRVYNLHLQSFYFGAEDYLFAQQAISNSDLSNDELKKNSIRILKKIKRGFAKRSVQVDIVANHIKLSPYKTIVCGDFNDTPWSYTYKQIQNLLDDSFVNSGKYFGNTMVINPLLPFRIDYIFHDKLFKSYGFATTKSDASDHCPVWTYVEF